MDWLDRTRMLLGTDTVEKIKNSRVWIFGLGGVGSYAAMAIARGGVENIVLVDSDCYEDTNRNRQLPAFVSTIGRPKTTVMAELIRDINPACTITEKNVYYSSDTADEFLFRPNDYIIDAIDRVPSKVLLIESAVNAGAYVISSMGTGNKLDASRFRVSKIEQTSVCPLAKVMRRELKLKDLHDIPVVFSDEPPLPPCKDENGRVVPASCSFVPPVCGFLLAGEVLKIIGCIS